MHLYQLTAFNSLAPARWVEAELSDDGKHGVAMVKYRSGATAVVTGGFERFGPNDFVLVGTEGVTRRQPAGPLAIERRDGLESIPIRQLDATREDNAAFLRCVRAEEDWRTHAEAERAILAIAVGAQQSAERGERIHL